MEHPVEPGILRHSPKYLQAGGVVKVLIPRCSAWIAQAHACCVTHHGGHTYCGNRNQSAGQPQVKGTGGVKASRGSIDEYGRVFDGGDVKLSDTHDGLFVVDGSAIPGALAMNPTLTITAQALKAVGHVLGSGAVSAPQANP